MSDCIIWAGGQSMGYGITYRNGRQIRAHQAAWLDAGQEIPDGYQLHHICRQKLCINVEHLRLLTTADHARLHSKDPRAYRNWNMGKTHCVHGHEFTPENTYDTPAGYRKCRRCAADREIRYRKRRRLVSC